MLRQLTTLALARTPLGSALRNVPLLSGAYRDHVWSRPGALNEFFGVFPDYATAAAALPEHLKGGWHNKSVVAASHVQPSLYAALFWLAQIVRSGFKIIDYGGAVGQAHTELTRRMALPAGVSWHVVDVGSAIARGRELAAERGIQELHFSESLGAIGGCDIFMSRGCLQYVREPVADILATLPSPPRYLLIDKVPLIEQPEFCTLQNLAVSAVPYKLFNRQSFLTALLDRGYSVRDEWPVWELKCAIPFHPERYVAQYAGLLLELRDAEARQGLSDAPEPAARARAHGR